MEKRTLKELLVVASMLFGMFFGAGNLIFPPFLGQNAGTQSLPALIGFLITAVGFPVLGIAVVSRFNGLDVLAQKVHAGFGLFFAVLIYLSIGPLLATPRTATLPFEMAILPLLPDGTSPQLSLLLFTSVFFLIAWLLSRNPSKLIDRLGNLSDALQCLYDMIDEYRASKEQEDKPAMKKEPKKKPARKKALSETSRTKSGRAGKD